MSQKSEFTVSSGLFHLFQCSSGRFLILHGESLHYLVHRPIILIERQGELLIRHRPEAKGIGFIVRQPFL